MDIRNELLEGSRALGTFLREYGDLIDKGWALPYTPHTDKHRIIYACNEDNVIVGGIVYGANTATTAAWIVFSFTVAAFRQQGVYTLLHNALEVYLKDIGVTDIASHVHVNNVVRQQVCEKVGMRPEFLRMKKKL